ncbi:reverse transcriptase domain-containing protein [Tanacetum coccineum]
MNKDRQFDGRARADPHKHIAEFIEICGMFQYGNTNVDSIKLKLFLSSISGEAKVWYNELSPRVIATWEQMRQAFDEEPLSKSSTTVFTMPLKPSLKPEKFLSSKYTFQYPMGVAENMLVQVGKFVFPVDFVILEMEEDNKFPLILGRPFLHTANVIIKVKNKELNLGVGDDRITFLIDKTMQHSHSNDDTCFRIHVIDEVTE